MTCCPADGKDTTWNLFFFHIIMFPYQDRLEGFMCPPALDWTGGDVVDWELTWRRLRGCLAGLNQNGKKREERGGVQAPGTPW